MASVSTYQIGLESTNTQVSYGLETTWAALPSGNFQAARIISESLKHTKTRTRPGEIRGDRQAAPAITTQENASGSLVMPVYYSSAGKASPFDDFTSCLMGGVWQTPTTITGAAADIVLTYGSGVAVVTSATANKFLGLANSVGQLVKLNGFTNTANNSWWRLSVYTSALSITLVPQGFVGVTETPTGANAKIYYSGMKNSTDFRSIYIQQRLDPAGTKWFKYPGSYPTRGSFTLNLGQFFQASYDLSAQQELKAVADSSAGITAAPTTLDFDPVSGFKGVYWNDILLTTAVDQFSLDLNNDGAGGQYGLGNPLAQGMLGGTFTASAKVRAYFSTFTYYDLFKAETPGILSIRTGDQAGNSYSFTAQNAVMLFDEGVNVDGPNKSLMSSISVELSPDTTSGCTLAIDRFPTTA
jgi:hypothetical protein